MTQQICTDLWRSPNPFLLGVSPAPLPAWSNPVCFAPRMLGPPLPAHSGGQLPATHLESSSSVLFSLTPWPVPPPPSWLLLRQAALTRLGPLTSLAERRPSSLSEVPAQLLGYPPHHCPHWHHWQHLKCVVGCLRSNVLVIIMIKIMSVMLISMYFVRISSKLLRRKLSCEFKLVKAPYSGSVPETIQNIGDQISS